MTVPEPTALQPGIAIAAGERPPPCWRLVLLNVKPGTTPAETCDAVARLTSMLDDLAAGRVRDLHGQPNPHAAATADQFAGLTTLLAFGRRLFDTEHHDPPLTTAARPVYLAYLPRDHLGVLPWRGDQATRPGEADLALQLTAPREAAVHCAAVEIWKLLADEDLPIETTATFSGFGRPDGRGWLDFHDGVSNLPAGERLLALSAPPDPPWMHHGTYLAFLRFAIDLAAWRRLPRPSQELLVGRDKLTGAALVATTRAPDGTVLPVPGPPPDLAARPEDRRDWLDPPQTTDPVLEASHVHRANQSRASAAAPGALRMFRQGYDALDGLGPEGPRAVMNFVSFQRDLQVVQHVLHVPNWLGDVAFGGSATPGLGEPSEPRFLTLDAGGLYAVPPRAQPFPGASVFGAEANLRSV
jgi:deferrochelatase/peroxidase EfeB